MRPLQGTLLTFRKDAPASSTFPGRRASDFSDIDFPEGLFMTFSRWGALAGALVLAAGAGAPAGALAQDSDRIARAFHFAGRGAHIGVSVEDLDDAESKQTRGVKVETVTPDGPADKAGIKGGDIITEFDGERVRSA